MTSFVFPFALLLKVFSHLSSPVSGHLSLASGCLTPKRNISSLGFLPMNISCRNTEVRRAFFPFVCVGRLYSSRAVRPRRHSCACPGFVFRAVRPKMLIVPHTSIYPTPVTSQAPGLTFSMGRLPAISPEPTELGWNRSFLGCRPGCPPVVSAHKRRCPNRLG
jgi:hypothetical protein